MTSLTATAAVLYEPGKPLRIEQIEVLPPQRGSPTLCLHPTSCPSMTSQRAFMPRPWE